MNVGLSDQAFFHGQSLCCRSIDTGMRFVNSFFTLTDIFKLPGFLSSCLIVN